MVLHHRQQNKVLRAAIRAHIETGIPMITHTSLGTMAKEQVDIFSEFTQAFDKIILSHVDLSGDIEGVLSLVHRGVNVGFDTTGKENYMPDITRVEMLKRLCDEGYSHKVLLSMDITRKSHLKYKGGLGYGYLICDFLPKLRAVGIKSEDIKNMTSNNARRIFGKGLYG